MVLWYDYIYVVLTIPDTHTWFASCSAGRVTQSQVVDVTTMVVSFYKYDFYFILNYFTRDI